MACYDVKDIEKAEKRGLEIMEVDTAEYAVVELTVFGKGKDLGEEVRYLLLLHIDEPEAFDARRIDNVGIRKGGQGEHLAKGGRMDTEPELFGKGGSFHL